MKKIVLIMASIVFLMAGMAVMANADTLTLGSTFNSIYLVGTGTGGLAEPVGGGSVQSASLNGVNLPYVYCIGLYTDVYVPGTFANTLVTQNGTVNGGTTITNAGQIAWLMNQYAAGATTAAQQIALQAAIWNVEYGNVSLNKDYYGQNSAVYQDYTGDLAALTAAEGVQGGLVNYVGNFDWLSPAVVPGTYEQDLITANVPEPATTLFLGIGMLGLAALRKRFKKA